MNSVTKSPIARFILSALGIFILWYVVYELWLLPQGDLDRWVAQNIVSVSAGIVQLFGYEVWSFNRVVGIMGNGGVELVDGCTGISAIGLFLGFVLAYPGNWRHRISFSVFGIAVIYLVNIIRVVTLIITQKELPSIFDFTHDYSTTLIFYLVIFFLWVLWVNLEGGIQNRDGYASASSA
jgi:exosortase family protein XrtF